MKCYEEISPNIEIEERMKCSEEIDIEDRGNDFQKSEVNFTGTAEEVNGFEDLSAENLFYFSVCSRIVPEYSFLDARGLGALEGRSLDAVSEVYESDEISPNNKPPPITDGTPNESVSDVFVRVTQLMSILETQYSEETIVILSPDSDNLSILQAGLTGVDLRRKQKGKALTFYFAYRHWDLSFKPGEVRLVDPESIPTYKMPASVVYKCMNPPSCT
ncbi:hypothetical protein M5K25_008503 [Dendrobium thyrsiflorum]|uniref:Uncharacterized protein n=1 Tax=Dendrobium thyrsiflorum TaxID=117978 RepID=A0ABD0V8U2_DENTH